MSVSVPTGSPTFARMLLRRQIDELRAADADARAGEPDAIHAVRIAARRLRSTLTSYRKLLPPTEARRLAEELRWLGSALSPARDAEVMRDRLLGALAATPDDLVVGLAVGLREVLERGVREDHAEAEGVVGPVALDHGDLVVRIGLLHQERQVEAGRSAA